MRNKLGLSWTNGFFLNSTTRERADWFLCEVANVPDHDHSPDGPNARKDENGVIHVETPAAVSDAWRRVYNPFHDLLPTHASGHRNIVAILALCQLNGNSSEFGGASMVVMGARREQCRAVDLPRHRASNVFSAAHEKGARQCI